MKLNIKKVLYVFVMALLLGCADPSQIDLSQIPTVAPPPSPTPFDTPTPVGSSAENQIGDNQNDSAEDYTDENVVERVNTDESLDVLFVGNSFTYYNDLPGMFRELAQAGGYNVRVDMVAEGGASLQDHSFSPETLDAIISNRWDYVVLQEQSQVPVFAALDYNNVNSGEFFADEMFNGAQGLDAIVQQQGGETVFFVAWGRDEERSKTTFPGQPMTSDEMQVYINSAYLKVAEDLGGREVVPVGSAWQAARKNDVADEFLWTDDGYHPDVAGTYLTACVFYASFFGSTPEGLAYAGGLNEDDALMLQKVAWDQVSSGSFDY
ncbi:MAG: DUF4886 domain-containing protein [Chloroflexota bacterium]